MAECLLALQNSPLSNLLVVVVFTLLILVFGDELGAYVTFPRPVLSWLGIPLAWLLLVGISLLIDTRDLLEVFALFAATLFFFYRFITGYFITNLSLSVTSFRQGSHSGGKDFLVVVAKLSKGERGSLSIHDAQVEVSWNGGKMQKPLIGIDRRSFTTDRSGSTERKVIDFGRGSKKAPFLRLTPGEETHFSCYLEVPSESVCSVDVIVLGQNPASSLVGQWRASTISMPMTAHH